MKVSQLFAHTLREAPSDATLPSHILLLRGGYIKPVSTGIYSLLPLGKRVARKIEAIIRQEMDAIDGQEVELPVVQPYELWKQSGRYDAIGAELLRFKDRGDHQMVLAMTHEEAVTELAASVLNSYKQLPFMLYQIQTKYRDEVRARGGLIRVREFVMKDAYSFHKDNEDLDAYYERCHEAYLRIFRRAGTEPIVVESDTGIMGGKVAHEFMLESQHGEDYLIICRDCGYQANAEIAEFTRSENKEDAKELEKVATPDQQSIEEVAGFLKLPATQTVKAVFYQDEENLYTVLTQGHLEISEVKLRNFLKVTALYPADAERIKESGMVPGYASPIGAKNTVVLADESVAKNSNLVCGANEEGYHFLNSNINRDYKVDHIGDFAQADTGSACPKCGEELEATRGIEIGNIFKLGTKFSESMGANFLDENGKSQPAVMGCYGIGVGRLLASAVEVHHDDWGICWPKSLTPYHVHLVTVGKKPELVEASEKLYKELLAAGIEVLWDDRKQRPGVKFKDADLWGISLRIGVGGKSLEQGAVEWKPRTEKDAVLVPFEEVVAKIKDFYQDA